MQIPTSSLLFLASLSYLVAAQVLGLENGIPDGWKGLELSSCTRQSVEDFVWTITGFEYRTSYLSMAPDEPGAESRSVSFQIFNPGTEGTSECSATTTGAFNGSAYFVCRRLGDHDYYRTRFSFAPGQLRIWDGWSCIEGWRFGGSILFSGTANVSLSLQCTGTSSIAGPGAWKPDDIYEERHTNCRAAEMTVKPVTLFGVPAND